MRSKSTEKADIILDFIDDYFDDNKSSPSLREIENATGISRQTALRYLRYMDENNVLQYDGKSGTVITKHMKDVTSSNIRKLPIIGHIACGDPMSEEETCEGYLDFPSDLLGSGTYFVLRTFGDSMINAGISEGDLVIVRKQSEAKPGQIVVAIDEDGQNTLKRLKFSESKNRYYLHPENDDYDDIYTDELRIQGVAIKVIKDLY